MKLTNNNAINSHRSVTFAYAKISQDFINQVIELLDEGESVVLLGSRGIGKQYVASNVSGHFVADDYNVVVRLCCEQHTTDTSTSICKILADQLANRIPNRDWEHCNSFSSLASEITKTLSDLPCRILFVVSNVEYLSDSVARRLLKLLRELTDLGRSISGLFGVLLTGASELAPLVHGKDSEFSVENQFVVTGMDFETFQTRESSIIRTAGMNISPICSDILFNELGGSLLLLQIVADSILEFRRINSIKHQSPIERDEVCQVIEHLKRYSSAFSDVVFRSFARIESDAISIRNVQELLCNGTAEIPNYADLSLKLWSENSPTELELCGIARRKGNQLIWTSPLMEGLARQYFTPWVIGDGLACNNEWELAFESYGIAKTMDLAWVCSTSQRPRLRCALRAFESKLFNIASLSEVPTDHLRAFFTSGAIFLLGFDEVTFWKYNDELQKWEYHQPSFGEWSSTSEKIISPESWIKLASQVQDATTKPGSMAQADFLRSPETLAEGINRPVDEEHHSLILRLPESDELPSEVVILSCSETDNPLTRDRLNQAELVCTAFAQAFAQSNTNRHHRRESELQSQLLLAMPEIFQVIGGSRERTRQALFAAGEILRQNGYRRVMFSLVDAARQRIKGEVDCRAEGECDIAELTDYTLNVPYDPFTGKPIYDDVQQACVLTQTRYLIGEAERHFLTNKEVVRAANQLAISVLPLSTNDGRRVVGTMHVERDDRKPLQLEQIRILELFADFVTRAVIAAENIDVLDDAISEQRDSFILLDHSNNIKYVNRSATNLIQHSNPNLTLTEGWQADESVVDSNKLLPRSAMELVRQARKYQQGLSRYLRDEKITNSNCMVSVQPLEDWRGCTVGTLVQLQEREGLDYLLTALRMLPSCRDMRSLNNCIIDAFQQMGHEWGRLYLLDPQNGKLVGEMQFGMEEGSDGAKAFENRTVVLPSKASLGTTWRCFQNGKATVFSYVDPEKDKERIEETWYTKNGLPILNTTETSCPAVLNRSVGDIWIDVPIFIRSDRIEDSQTPLGKLSLHCPKSLSPTKLEWLEILAEAVSTVLSAFSERENWVRDTERLCRQSMLHAIDRTCHRLQSKFTSLPTLAAKYNGATPDQIMELNEQFDRRLTDIQGILETVKLRLQPVRCETERREISDFLKNLFGEHLPHDAYRVVGHQMYAEFDPELLKEAIEELIQNSRKAVGKGNRLTMNVVVSQESDRIGKTQNCVIRIKDNGPGIPVENQEMIFDDWFHEWDVPTEGTGLGLSRVQNIINAHKGTIMVESSPQGAQFVIAFPRF